MLKKTGFQTKMIFYQIAIIIGIISILIVIFYQSVVTTILQQVSMDYETIIQKTAMQYETLVYDMDKTVLMVAANPNIVKAFTAIDKNVEENYFIDEPVMAGELVKLLNSYNFKQSGVTRICLYNQYGDFICTATRATTVSGIEKFIRSERVGILLEHFNQEGNFVYYPKPEADILSEKPKTDGVVFSVIREIKDYSSNSQICGYVEVQEDENKIDALFRDLGKDSHAVILDEKNQVIWESKVGAWKDKSGIFKQLERREYQAGGFYYDKNYVSLVKLTKVPFSILVQKGRDGHILPLFQFNMVLIIGVILILITAVLTEILLIHKLTKPLIELKLSMKEINLDNYKMDMLESQNSDELMQLQDTFNAMLQGLKISMDRQYVAETNELKSHLFALQSQMNPHFLHNILAIISMEAQADGNDKIQNMCAKLCRILRFTSSMEDGFCSVEQEIKNAENYMVLMKERYEECFEYEVFVGDNIKALRIPKLIVQPICENSFEHAFKNQQPIWKIQISAYERENRWYVEIHDNGNGFEETYLEQFAEMKKNITLTNVKENLERISIGGLCIPNIYMRLKLCYAEEFVCDLFNDENGAVVLLGGGFEKHD